MKKLPDWLLLLATGGLLTLGCLTIASTSPASLPWQVAYAVLGMGLFLLFSRIDYRIYGKLAWFCYFGSLIALALTFVFGSLTRGATRWIEVGGITIQPSELAKPALILFFAYFLSQELTNRRIIAAGLLLVAPVGLIFVQPDLGSSLVVILIWLGLILAAGIGWRWLAAGAAFFVTSLPLAWFFLKDYQKERIHTFINPFTDPLHAGYNLIQSIVAVGSGQLFGRGLGRGTQSHLQFLPERHTDFIFASLAEELGFAGAIVLLLLLALLLGRILVLSKRAEDKVGSLICIGVFTMIFSQAFINIGMNLGLLPVTGITLPLISSGGSSLVTILISLGLVENVARFIRKNEVKYFL